MQQLPTNLIEILHTLASFCAARGLDAWLVGGAARDIAMGRVPGDLDVAVAADGVVLARAFANQVGGAFVALDDERGTGRVVCDPHGADRLIIDLVQLRAPTLEEDLRLRDFTINAIALPLSDERGTKNEEETALSSFLVSRSSFIDPCGGLADIAARQLRPCSRTSLPDDPLRILRAARLAAGLGLQIAPDLDQAIRETAPLIRQVAGERIRDELLKLLAAPNGGAWLRYLDDARVLTTIIPELEPARACDQPRVHFLPVLAHSLETVVCVEWLLAGIVDFGSAIVDDQPRLDPTFALPVAVQTHPDLTRDIAYIERLREHFSAEMSSGHSRVALLKMAALLHDVAKPQTKQVKEDGSVSFYGHQELGTGIAQAVGRRLRLSRSEIAYMSVVVREHMRPGQLRTSDVLTRRAVVRFFRDTGGAGPDVLLHELADHLATRGPFANPADWRNHLDWVEVLLDLHWGKPPERAQPLINGEQLMAALGLEPGRLVGALLREVSEAQAAGEVTTSEEALALARELVSKQQL